MKEFWKKKTIKDIASVGSADLIGSGISAVLWFTLAYLIEVEQYGEIHYFIAIAGLVYTVSVIGTRDVITVYIAKRVKIESTLYFISIISGITGSIVVFLIFFRLDVSFLILAYIMNDLSIAYLLGQKRYVDYSKYNIVQKILSLGLVLGFYYIFGVEGILYGIALSYVHFLVIIYKVFVNTKINLSLLKSRWGFITNNYLMNQAGAIRGQTDKIIVGPMLGLSVLGNYSLATQFYEGLNILSRIVFRYTLPQDASGNSTKKLKKITILVSVGISILGIILLPSIITTIFPKYLQSIEAIQIMSLAIISSTINQMYTSKFLGLEKSKYVVVARTLSVVVTIVGIIILGPIFGLNGVVTAFVLASLTITITYVSISRSF